MFCGLAGSLTARRQECVVVNTGVRADGGSQGAQVSVQHQLAMYRAHASVNSTIKGPRTDSTSYMDNDLQYLIYILLQ